MRQSSPTVDLIPPPTDWSGRRRYVVVKTPDSSSICGPLEADVAEEASARGVQHEARGGDAREGCGALVGSLREEVAVIDSVEDELEVDVHAAFG